jgi:hypothetical protein
MTQNISGLIQLDRAKGTIKLRWTVYVKRAEHEKDDINFNIVAAIKFVHKHRLP